MRRLVLAFPAAAMLLAASCGGSTRESPSSGLKVFAGILPLSYLVERVGADRVSVQTLVQPGQDPHTYEPTPRQVADLTEARLYFQVGMPFENALLERLRSMRNLRVVDTREGIELEPMVETEGDRHGEPGLDPHVWMDPLLARRQARTIVEALLAADPEGRAVYEAGYERLARELESVHAELTSALAPYQGRELFVYHPAFGYFARAFGLRQVAVETGGKEPSARELARLIDLAKGRGARVVFVQPQFSQSGARAVADAIGGAVVPIDDLAYDYIVNLRRTAAAVADALGKQTGSP